MVDQRKDKRAPASLKVKYKSATVDQFIGQLATDVSRGGMFVKTKTPLALGALIKLELQLSDASPVIQGIGRVCWRREATADATVIPGMGIKFVKVDPDSRAIVERIVQSRGDKPSRFDQTAGAEIAPPSIAPPAASGAPPPITAPPPPITAPPPSPSPAVAATPGVRAPAPPRVPNAAPPGSITAHAPLPSGGSSAAHLPVPAPASAPLSVPKAAPSKPGAARPVAGLFADSPLSRNAGGEPSADLRARSSFFGAPPSVPGRPASGRSEQARQSGQFLATAFAEGGLAADTTAQARAAAEANTDEVDDLFDEVVKTSEIPAPPPIAAKSATLSARAAQTSAERESVDDMFAELSQEEGLPSHPAARASGTAFGSASAKLPSAPSGFDEEERTTERTSVDELLDGLDDDVAPAASGAPASAPPVDVDDFGEADDGAAESVSPSAPPMLRMPSNAPAAPLEVAQAMQRSSSSTPILIALIVVAAAAFGGFYFYKQRVAEQRRQAERQAAPTAEPAAPAPSAGPAQPANAAPAAQQPAAEPPANAPTAAAPAQPAAQAQKPAGEGNGARVEVEVSSVPRGADITIDGKPAGTTPTRVTLVVDKPAEVKVTTAGYTPMTRSLVPAADNEPLRFKLEPLPYALVVRSTPPDAQISVGEHVATAPAPLDLGHLDGGVQVSISREGFQRMTRLVRLDEFSDQGGVMRAEIEVKLNPLPGAEKQPAAQQQSQRARPKPPARPREAPPPPAPNEPEAAAPPSAAVEPKAPAEAAPAPAPPPKAEQNLPPSAAPAPPAPPAPPTPP